jgi:acetyl-CoA acetyltransferase
MLRASRPSAPIGLAGTIVREKSAEAAQRRWRAVSDRSIFPRSQVAIAGIGCTEFSKNSGMSTMGLAARAVKTALTDAGLELRDVDGLATFGPGDSVPPNVLAQSLGMKRLNYFIDQYLGGSVAMSIIASSALAVATGAADCVVCYRALNGRSEQRLNAMQGGGRAKSSWDVQYKMPTGYVMPAQEIAMAARAHMSRFGTTNEDLGSLAILCRTNALENERSMMRRPMTMDDYLASPWISEPFRVLDCSLETDGAVALVIVSAERAKDLPHRPVLLQGAAWGSGVSLYNNGVTDLAESPAKPLAKRLYQAAGVGVSDFDFAELYDCFTYTLLAQIEGYGLAEEGAVPEMLRDGVFDAKGGSMPINTHGGLLSEGYLHGFNHVYEAVEQIRGEAAPHRQLERHDTALVAGMLGYVSAYSSSLVLSGA